MEAMNEASWKRLLNQIRDGMVVPVVGPQLLVGVDGQSSLQARIAERLLTTNGCEVGTEGLPPFRELNEAVSRLKPIANLSDLYDEVHEAIRELTTTNAACRSANSRRSRTSAYSSR